MLPDDQVHPDTHVLTMASNVIGVVNYVIAARPSLLNFVIADTGKSLEGQHGCGSRIGGQAAPGVSGCQSATWRR